MVLYSLPDSGSAGPRISMSRDSQPRSPGPADLPPERDHAAKNTRRAPWSDDIQDATRRRSILEAGEPCAQGRNA